MTDSSIVKYRFNDDLTKWYEDTRMNEDILKCSKHTVTLDTEGEYHCTCTIYNSCEHIRTAQLTSRCTK